MQKVRNWMLHLPYHKTMSSSEWEFVKVLVLSCLYLILHESIKSGRWIAVSFWACKGDKTCGCICSGFTVIDKEITEILILKKILSLLLLTHTYNLD